MNNYTKQCLYHAWGKSPEDKAKERTYNTGYYQAHREKIIRNVLARRKAKNNKQNISIKRVDTSKNANIPVYGIDTIIESLNKRYDEYLSKRREKQPGYVIPDYRKGGEVMYDIVHGTINIGKKIINAFRNSSVIEQSKSIYSEGFDWLKKHW